MKCNLSTFLFERVCASVCFSLDFNNFLSLSFESFQIKWTNNEPTERRATTNAAAIRIYFVYFLVHILLFFWSVRIECIICPIKSVEVDEHKMEIRNQFQNYSVSRFLCLSLTRSFAVTRSFSPQWCPLVFAFDLIVLVFMCRIVIHLSAQAVLPLPLCIFNSVLISFCVCVCRLLLLFSFLSLSSVFTQLIDNCRLLVSSTSENVMLIWCANNNRERSI